MIGVLIVTHAGLAREFVVALEHILGKKQSQLEAICIAADDDMHDVMNLIKDKIDLVNSGKGVIILTDMFGGTPSNLAISMTDNHNIEVLAGVNLPALVKLMGVRHNNTVQEAVRTARDAGVKYMKATCDFFETSL